MNRPKLLLTHPWMGRGGSEATAMWALEALQDEFEVTFSTASPLDFDDLNQAFGTKVDPQKIRFIQAPRIPTVNNPFRLAHLQIRFFERFCQKLARKADFCVSTYNPVQFGRPSIQLIGDFSFSEGMRKRLYVHGDSKFCHRETIVRRLYLSFAELISVPQIPLADRGDLILANSNWSAKQLCDHFHVSEAKVIYPPVVLPEAPSHSVRDPLGFVCLGRVVPEKEIDRVITILEMVRGEGFPVTLSLIGQLDDSRYSNRIQEMISSREWIIPKGFLSLRKKQDVLASQTFALHACRIEAFGIAVAEMASMGCIPLVPDTGGAGEIVPFPELQFATNEEACAKILELIKDPESIPRFRESLSARVARFGPEAFRKELREHLGNFAGLKKTSVDADSKQNLAPAH